MSEGARTKGWIQRLSEKEYRWFVQLAGNDRELIQFIDDLAERERDAALKEAEKIVKKHKRQRHKGCDLWHGIYDAYQVTCADEILESLRGKK